MRSFRRGASADEIIENGVIPRETVDLDGEVLTLPAKMTKPEAFTSADIYEMSPSAGAGWGDPLDRAAALVAADVRDGDVSVSAAETIYGVILRDGALDEAATDKARAAIREARKSWPLDKTLSEAPDPAGDWDLLAPVGDMASISRISGNAFFRCGCGSAIAPASENWKSYARRGSADAADLGPRIKLHADLDAALYACPSCARVHAVEFGMKGEAPLWDIELDI
jgi:N-methylhydantoinase B